MSDADLRAAAERLSVEPTASTAHMEHGERANGVHQMLLDLRQLATRDGCVAAAWALEKLLAHRPDDGEPVEDDWLGQLKLGMRVEVHMAFGVAVVSVCCGPPMRWTEIIFPGVRTRGDVRALLRMLGVEAKEVGDGSV